jgi:hypothetical protein
LAAWRFFTARQAGTITHDATIHDATKPIALQHIPIFLAAIELIEELILHEIMPPTHIVNGHVVRHSRLPQSRFLSWKRLFLLLVPALILVGTNPANQDYVFNTLLTDRTAGTSHVRGTFVFGRRITNNGLFSLEKTSDRLILHALQQSCSCSFNDDEIGWLCAKVGESVIFGCQTLLPKQAFCRVS